MMETGIQINLTWLILLVAFSATALSISLVLWLQIWRKKRDRRKVIAQFNSIVNNSAYKYEPASVTSETAVEATDILLSNLQQAMQKNEFFLVYQPKIAVKTGLVIGAEALIRWLNPELGLVSPETFIPLAEKLGLIVPLGEWIIKTAGVDLKRLHADGLVDLTVAVNVSAAQFNAGDVVSMLVEQINATNLPPQLFEVEITESLVMDNLAKIAQMLRTLKSMGVKIAMDDFGTGHSSLSQLQYLPVDILKIDQSFVKGMQRYDRNHAIVATIVNLARKLELKVVAEGVENDVQVQILREEGCDYFQGYYYSKPLAYAEYRQYCMDNIV